VNGVRKRAKQGNFIIIKKLRIGNDLTEDNFTQSYICINEDSRFNFLNIKVFSPSITNSHNQ
jgi:hypothetical protein